MTVTETHLNYGDSLPKCTKPPRLAQVRAVRRWHGQCRFLDADERGSIVAVTGSAGALLGLNKYDEYGQPQSSNLGAFGYTGQAWLPSIGEWYYKARVYDTELGRFLQPDPIGYEDSSNLYAYVGNDPVNFVDPLGLADIVVTASRIHTIDGGGGGGAVPFIGDMFGTTVDVSPLLPELGSEVAPQECPTTGEAPQGCVITVKGKKLAQIVPRIGPLPIIANDGPSLLIAAGADFDSGLSRDPVVLEKELAEARRKGDKQKIRRIIRQQKMLGLRNINKQRGLGRFRGVWWYPLLIEPLIDDYNELQQYD